MISTELLSQIFEVQITRIHNIDAENNIHFNGGNEKKHPYSLINPITINIFELTYKCKEFLIKKGYFFDISHSTMGLDCRVIVYGKGIKEYFIEETEREAIFKACEWIIKQ